MSDFGQCGRCGRTLKTPDYIAIGFWQDMRRENGYRDSKKSSQEGQAGSGAIPERKAAVMRIAGAPEPFRRNRLRHVLPDYWYCWRYGMRHCSAYGRHDPGFRIHGPVGVIYLPCRRIRRIHGKEVKP